MKNRTNRKTPERKGGSINSLQVSEKASVGQRIPLDGFSCAYPARTATFDSRNSRIDTALTKKLKKRSGIGHDATGEFLCWRIVRSGWARRTSNTSGRIIKMSSE
jgi:hypothetical protein